MQNFAKQLFTLASVAAAALTGTAAFADAPGYARIRSISYAGSGCPAGTVSQNVAPDLQAFTLIFDSFLAEKGPGIPLSQSRKNCQVALDVDFPSGWSYTVMTVDYRGYVALDAGVRGTQKSTYYFQGQSRQAPLSTVMTGPRSGDYQIRDTLGLSAVVWSPCGAQRALNINAQVRVEGGTSRNAQGMITLDSIDGQLKHVYGIRWQRCRAPGLEAGDRQIEM